MVFTSARKKTAVARARIKQGTGIMKINDASLAVLHPDAARIVIQEPLMVAEDTLGKEFWNGLDIRLSVVGGGVMGRAYACRTALGKALVEYSKNEDLKKTFTKYDRSLLVDDVRRKESKKYLRKGARAKPIKSYR